MPKLMEFCPFKCQGHPVSLWCCLSPVTSNCLIYWDLFKAYITEKDNYDIWMYWWDIALATCCLSQTLLNMKIEGNFKVTLWCHWWCHYHEKYFLGIIWDELLIYEVKLKVCLMFKIFKLAVILRSWQTFLPEVIPEVEYASKIVMSISDILSLWSML